MPSTGNNTLDAVFGIGTCVVTIASILSNVLPKNTIVYKACNFLALNFAHLFGSQGK